MLFKNQYFAVSGGIGDKKPLAKALDYLLSLPGAGDTFPGFGKNTCRCQRVLAVQTKAGGPVDLPYASILVGAIPADCQLPTH